VQTQINGVQVDIREVTDYPNEETIRFELSLSQNMSFPLHFRIPSWTDEPKLSVNGEAVEGLIPGQMVTLEREWSTGDVLELQFPMKVSVSRWFENSAAIERGPLVYALDVKGKWEKKINQNGNRKGQEYWEVKATSPWNYSLIQSDIQKPETSFTYNEDGSISARAVLVPHWIEVNGDAAPIPYTPIRQYGTYMGYGHKTGEVETIRLIPYGETTLRIAEFPVLKK
jgi:hypothetical protein